MNNRTVARFFLSKKNALYLLKVFSINLVVLGIFIIKSTHTDTLKLSCNGPQIFSLYGWFCLFLNILNRRDPFEGAMH